jgi:hypothetical protein
MTPDPTRPERALGLVLALAVVVFNIAWVATVMGRGLHRPKHVLESDHLHYIEMARGYERALARAAGEVAHADARPELAGRAPYCWRVAVPAAAALLARAGLNLHLGFFLLTNLALLGFLYVLWCALGEAGFERRLRVAGLVLVGLMQGAVRWFEYQYWMTDPAGLLVVAQGLRLARRVEQDGRPALLRLGVLLAAGALVRETWVLVVPCAFLFLVRRSGVTRAVAATAVLAAPAASLTLLLRRLIEPTLAPGLFDSIVDNVGFRLNHIGDNQIYVLTLGTWGVLLPLACLAPGRWAERGRRELAEWALLAFVYVTTVLISNNNDRPLAYALPAVLPAALLGLRRLEAASAGRARQLLGLVVALQALFYAQTRFTGLGISVYQPVSWPVALSLIAFWVGAAVMLRRAEGRGA